MTSISDRCKTAQEGATPGPWREDHLDEDFPSVMSIREKNGLLIGTPIAEEVREPGDLALIALAPEAADEVIRLTGALEALAEWHDREAELTGHLGRTPAIMRISNQHTDAAARIRRILNGEGDHP